MTGLDKRVLDAIERRGLKPRPYGYFLARRAVLWSLSVASVVLGAIAVAVLIFVVQDYIATGGEGFDEMPLDDVFEALPYVWATLLALTTASAFVSMRQTPRGYRYRAWHIVVGVLAGSVALGLLLHALDAGRRVHELLSARVPLYTTLTAGRDKSAPDPDQGVLAGRVVGFDGKTTLTVSDFKHQTWTVDVLGAEITLDEPLGSDEDVEIKGIRTGPRTFRARSIADWD